MENFICLLAIGITGAFIAKKRKLNPFFWFTTCFILGLIGLFTFIFLPFFLEKWKKKNSPTQKTASEPVLTSLFSLKTIWYYLSEEEKQIGPMSFARLLEMKKEELIQENSYIWNESFSHWKQWTDVFPREKPKG